LWYFLQIVVIDIYPQRFFARFAWIILRNLEIKIKTDNQIAADNLVRTGVISRICFLNTVL